MAESKDVISEAVKKICVLLSISEKLTVITKEDDSIQSIRNKFLTKNKKTSVDLSVDLDEKFIFVDSIDNPSSPFNFWVKIMCNIGMAVKYDVSNNDILSVLYKVSLLKIDERKLKFVLKVLESVKKLNDEFRKVKVFKDNYIDEIDNHANILHNKGTVENKKKLLSFSFLRSAIEDWTKQNQWILLAEEKTKLKFLIIDDVMANTRWPIDGNEITFLRELKSMARITNNITKGVTEWSFFRLVNKNGDFYEYVSEFPFGDAGLKIDVINVLIKKEEKVNLQDGDFTHILIDWKLDELGRYSGFNLLRDFKSWINRISNSEKVVPELLIFSRNPDPVTIQSALEAGASGYIIKDNIAELPLVVGRSGRPLNTHQKKEIDSLISENFPTLKSFPSFVPKALYLDKWEKGCNDTLIIENHKDFLKEIPKADLHVHFGTAIPVDICYDLAIISIYRWACQYRGKSPLGNEGKYNQLNLCAQLIANIINETIKRANNTKEGEKEFRDVYINAFREITKIHEIATVNNSIKRLTKRFDKLNEEIISCLIVAGFGLTFYNYGESLGNRIKDIQSICQKLTEADREKNPLLSFYLQDTKKVIIDINERYNSLNAEEILELVRELIKITEKYNKTNPISNVLGIPNTLQEKAEGLPKYLGAGDIVGASLLQFAETLLLASFHIPKWAAEQNVWHQELRASSTGFLKGFDNATIATKIMLLGIYAGIKDTEKDKQEKHLTTSVLITAKRHKKKEEIEKSAILATEFMIRNENVINDAESGEFIPKVLGMDLAGIERGNLPDDLVKQFRESFRRCMMMTVHAGEDESVQSVWQAVYSLHALRVGHGLKLSDYPDLKRLFRDRQLCVELCPKSNQFTNGYNASLKDKEYVFQKYHEYGIPLTINTDNPLLSHRTDDTKMPYPLSEEYLLLPKLLGVNKNGDNSNKPPFVNTLLILKLIYNGFKYSFLSPVEKSRLIKNADIKVFNTLAKQFLDEYIKAEK